MKIDRHDPDELSRFVKLSFTAIPRQIGLISVFAILFLTTPMGQLQSQAAPPATATESLQSAQSQAADGADNQRRAAAVIEQVIDRLANGTSFDCKIRQRVRTAGREVLGVGAYLQIGGGTGQFSFQIDMHDGDGNHRLQQISDGRLTWTRSEIAGVVSLSRVDVGWLDEGARTLRRHHRVKPSMKVGGPSEMLDSILLDYDLKLGTSSLAGRPLVVVIGTLKQSRRDEITASLHGTPWPMLYPTRVNVAIAQEDDPESGFGKGLPVRIEHLSDPVALSDDPKDEFESQIKKRQIISLLEFYSIRPVAQLPIERFRFENQDTEIDFVNETSRYESRFKIQVSAKERERYR